MAEQKYLAIDLGAESGRGIVGSFDGRKISLREIGRFPTRNGYLFSHMHWNVLSIFDEIKKIVGAALAESPEINGIGVTTWGVDYGLIGKNDLLLSLPFHYRDKRTDGMMEEVFAKVGRDRVFEETGVQMMQINTLFQVYATLKEYPELLSAADRMLFMPDLFNFLLTGEKCAEFTIASTSQMYNQRASGQPRAPRGDWVRGILGDLGIPTHFLPDVVSPGTPLGPIRASLREELGIGPVPVSTVCCHDTASAVVSVPAQEGRWAYLSSGTWSLLGIETMEPIITEKSARYNFTNEGGYGGTIRFLKNIMGLWILQECRRTWERQGSSFTYEELTEAAAAAEPFISFINVEDSSFLFPGDMPERVREFCRKTGQRVPSSPGETARVVLESLAMEYRYVLENMEETIGEKISSVHIVGGGSQNRLLSRFAACAAKKMIVAGPVEATGAGNILMQALSAREIADVPQIRTVVRNSFPLVFYQPEETALWDEKYRLYRGLKAVPSGG